MTARIAAPAYTLLPAAAQSAPDGLQLVSLLLCFPCFSRGRQAHRTSAH